MPLATDTFMLSTAPTCGSRTRKSQFLRVSSRRPSPSPPMTSATRTRQDPPARPVCSPCHVGADDPLAGILHQLQGTREIGDRHQRQGLGRAGRNLAHRGIHAGGAILRHDHGQRTAGIGRAQAGTQIVRILHPVEHQHQRILRRRSEPRPVHLHAMASADRLRPSRPGAPHPRAAQPVPWRRRVRA